MIADLTPADMVADPVSCLAIFEDRVRIEQLRLEQLDSIVRELTRIVGAQDRLQALLDGREPAEDEPHAALLARPRVPAPGRGSMRGPARSARSASNGGGVNGSATGGSITGRSITGGAGGSVADGASRERPGRHLDRAMEVLAGEPQRRWSAPEIAALIGADADWLRFVLHSAANRGLVKRHAQTRPAGSTRGRPVAIRFSAA
ncbi:hypothetical protein ABH940_001429 [Streptacidiphilus sp. BW17]|uniref:hypothetical protein n=1 Tax=Streptacidiphilus sp. BW17 TaxID=3156274 RepID=UPI003513A5AC